MVTKKIERKYNCTTTLEYEEKDYGIDYIKEEGYIYPSSYFILRRLSDNKIIKVFDGNVSNIIQIKKDNTDYFIVIKYNVGRAFTKIIFSTYKALEEGLTSLSKYEGCDYTRLKEDKFILYKDGKKGCLSNINGMSKDFDYVYDENEIKEIIGDDTILVDEVRESKYIDIPKVRDKITYGIDIDTFDERIIKLEIQVPLDEVARKIDHGPSVHEGSGINKEFVKKFKN